jgi:hypothetical protein
MKNIYFLIRKITKNKFFLVSSLDGEKHGKKSFLAFS